MVESTCYSSRGPDLIFLAPVWQLRTHNKAGYVTTFLSRHMSYKQKCRQNTPPPHTHMKWKKKRNEKKFYAGFGLTVSVSNLVVDQKFSVEDLRNSSSVKSRHRNRDSDPSTQGTSQVDTHV